MSGELLHSDLVLDSVQVARLLGKSPKTIHRYCQLGRIPAIKVGGKWLIRSSQVPYVPATPKTGPPRLLGVREAALELDWDPETVRLLCENGKLPAERVGRGRWRISAEALADAKDALSNGRNGRRRRMRGGRRL